MDFVSFFSLPFDIANVLTDPIGAIKGLLVTIILMIAGFPLADIFFRKLDDAILILDDKVIDKIPVKAVKNFFQKKLIKRLEKRISRYNDIIKKISD